MQDPRQDVCRPEWQATRNAISGKWNAVKRELGAGAVVEVTRIAPGRSQCICVGQFHRADVFGTPLLWGDDREIYATFVSGPDDSIGSPEAFNFEKVMRTQVHSSAAA